MLHGAHLRGELVGGVRESRSRLLNVFLGAWATLEALTVLDAPSIRHNAAQARKGLKSTSASVVDTFQTVRRRLSRTDKRSIRLAMRIPFL